MKIALLGYNGFIGNIFLNYLRKQDLEFIGISRKDCDFLNKDKLYKTLKKINPKYLINCAGYTGKPNVDACESNKELCWQGNYTVPKNISEICKELNKKWIHVSSGCIYSGEKNKLGFTEKDEPNFSFDKQPCSYYSGTKAVAEDFLKFDKNVYICRLRIPFNSKDCSKNYITKILRYETLLNVRNSMSNTDEFVEACVHLMDNNEPTGIYNIVNTGSITTKEVTKLITKYFKDKTFKFFKNQKEFYNTAAITPRSNCVLDNSKLIKSGFKISDIHDKMESCIRNYSK